MPENSNSKVSRCVRKVKGREGKVPAIRICQASTGQNYKSGRKNRSKMHKKLKHKLTDEY